MKRAFLLLTFFLILSANNKRLFAQNVKDEPFIAESNASGEETVLNIENLVRDAKSSGERVFVISRLNKREAPRWANVRSRITRWKLSSMSLAPQQIIIAEGEKVEEEGRIELYLGSRLRLVILAKHNKMPNLTCCEDYVPPTKRTRKKRKIKNLTRTKPRRR
ncbi:MAG: hypothetical protein M3033_15320 [Acidobacteriota bacterium]|nr:hypothetical protein [Acidobacteriota bacterium]